MPWREATLVLETGRADRILDWDPVTGRLTAEAGLSLSEVLGSSSPAAGSRP